MSHRTRFNLCLVLAAVCFVLTACTPVFPLNLIFTISGIVCLYADVVFKHK